MSDADTPSNPNPKTGGDPVVETADENVQEPMEAQQEEQAQSSSEPNVEDDGREEPSMGQQEEGQAQLASQMNNLEVKGSAVSGNDPEVKILEVDDQADDLLDLPEYMVERVAKLLELHEKRDTIMETYLKERAKLEQKYQGLYQPLYNERAQIVAGTKDEASEGDKDEAGDPVVVGVPHFWVQAMSQYQVIGFIVTEDDVDCLQHLHDIKCINNADGSGFRLEFHFGPNEYFTNQYLTKTYDVPNLLVTGDEPILKNVHGCKIHWVEGKELTFRYINKQQRGTGKKAGQVRTVKKKIRRDSFFHFFDPPKLPSMAKMNEEKADQLEQAFDHDYDVAQAFRTQIIPKAVTWFTGQAVEEEEVAAMGQVLFPEGEEDDGPDISPFPAPKTSGENPECKQT